MRGASRSLILLAVFCSLAQASDVDIDLQPCTYSQLGELIHQSKGKVILVDVWGEFCPPCKKKFPAMVDLNQKYLGKGLRCFSVSVDDSTDRDARTRALQFLKEQKATFTNLLLTEDPKLWQEKWQIPGPPCLFLFDAEGRLIQKWAGGEIVAATVEARVKELLKGD